MTGMSQEDILLELSQLNSLNLRLHGIVDKSR